MLPDRFLSVSLDYLGHVPHDPALRESVRQQRPFCEAFPEGPAARSMRKIARRVSELENNPLNSDLGLLWRNVLVSERSFLSQESRTQASPDAGHNVTAGLISRPGCWMHEANRNRFIRRLER